MFVSVGEPDATVSHSLQSSALLSIESAQLLSHYDGSLGMFMTHYNLLVITTSVKYVFIMHYDSLLIATSVKCIVYTYLSAVCTPAMSY